MDTIAYGRSLSSRVAQNTSPLINQMILDGMRKSLLFYAEHPEGIEDRIGRLKGEPDIEQTLEANASILGLFGLFMALVVRSRLFILLPIAALAFLLQHSLRGWSAPDMLLRRLGFRTKEEIQLELYGLRMLRGDFNTIPAINDMAVRDRVEWVIDVLSA
ncbi:MAG TPA: hypothetical protein PKM41_01140 [Deltaproteobacteria bacterium]|mgnify:CR=1 FL=1|jgi:hypothetical protein|nr:hypothetical protein [Deltaproteobacteria bacterium]HOI06686.1 hypothetical protein [Deltaproteobacteria bacterium]